MMPSSTLIIIVSGVLATLLAIIWWLRHSPRGLDWILTVVPLAFAASYFSSFIFRVTDYQAGCDGLCPGWRGFPSATFLSNGVGSVYFNPTGFIINAGIYYSAILVFSVIIALLARWLQWTEHGRRWRIGFVTLAIVLPLALSPTWLPPRQPHFTAQYQRLTINAARAWRWQLRFKRLSDLRLQVEDVRLHPDGERHRVCFRAYTWFYIPYDKVYIDLEPAGVRATGGGVISPSESCWVQP